MQRIACFAALPIRRPRCDSSQLPANTSRTCQRAVDAVQRGRCCSNHRCVRYCLEASSSLLMPCHAMTRTMIKNAGRLVARAARRKRARAGACESAHTAAPSPLLLPAFLLPAWHGSVFALQEKTVARSHTLPSSGIPAHQQQRHASSYAHADLVQNTDSYAPDWLDSDALEAPPTPSTSKVQQDSKQGLFAPHASGATLAQQGSHISPSSPSSAKGKAPERTTAALPAQDRLVQSPPNVQDFPQPISDDASVHTHQPDTDIRHTNKPRSSSFSTQAFDFPTASLPLHIKQVLHGQNHKPDSIPFFTVNSMRTIENAFIHRLESAEAIFKRYLSISSPHRPKLPSADMAQLHAHLRELAFLDNASIQTILDSLDVMQGNHKADTSNIQRLLPELLLLYTYRDLVVLPSKQTKIEESAATVRTGADEAHIRFCSKHIASLTRHFRSLRSQSRQAFVAYHLPVLFDIIESIPVNHTASPKAVFQTVHCFDRDRSTSKSQPIQPDETLKALLKLCLLILNHLRSPQKVGKARFSLNQNAYDESLETGLLRSWTHCILPYLKRHFSSVAPSDECRSLLLQFQNVVHDGRLTKLAAQIVLDIGLLDEDPETPKYMCIVPSERYQETTTLCLQKGYTAQVERLLSKLTTFASKNPQHLPRLWHQRLQAIIKAYSDQRELRSMTLWSNTDPC